MSWKATALKNSNGENIAKKIFVDPKLFYRRFVLPKKLENVPSFLKLYDMPDILSKNALSS